VAHQTAKADIANIQTQLDDTATEIRRLKNQKDATEAYRRTVDVWKEYNSNKWWRQSSKDKFFEDNKADIDDYKAARDYIYVDLKLEKFPNLKTLSGKITELNAKQKELQTSLIATREKSKMLNITTHNACMVLGYKELEEQGTDPTATHHNTPLYQSSFAQANKSGELAKYFQSQTHNKNCAKDIRNALPAIMAGYNKALEDVVGAYGADRITWVLAHVMANDTADGTTSGTASSTAVATMSHATIKTAKEFLEHKDWASQVKLPNEAIPEYDLKCNAALSTFINQFQDYMRMFRARRAWEQGQTQSLSMADKLAIAQEKADEHNAGRAMATPQPQKPTPAAETSPPKPKKKVYGMGR